MIKMSNILPIADGDAAGKINRLELVSGTMYIPIK
jgi:hypothetical protein